MKAGELATLLDSRLVGDPQDEITGVSGIENATSGQLTFVANPKYAPLARTTGASLVLVEEAFPDIPIATLRTANPYLAFARAISLFHPPLLYPPAVHPTAVIHASALVGARAHIGAYVVIEEGVCIVVDAVLLPHVVIYPGASIGNRFFAHAHAIVREGCRLGDDITLGNGAIVGSDGFGFARASAGWEKIPQSGPAVLEDRVEVQANSCIDRASIGETRIARGVKIDNLVQVGHGSAVGENTLLCSQAGLAGSTRIGRNVILAGQVGVAGHCTVGDGVVATAQTGIPNDVAAGSTVSGYPAIDNRQWLRAAAVFNRLPEVHKTLQRLTKKLAENTALKEE